MTIEQIKAALNLKPHPKEGGFFSEVYRSDEIIGMPSLPARYSGSRSFCTAIYYLLTPDTFSAMHRIKSDEIFHFYLGDPVEMLQLGDEDGAGRLVMLGADIYGGMMPQVVVNRSVWQGSRLTSGGAHGFALLGTTVAPGFDYADYEHGNREYLIDTYPEFKDMIVKLTIE